MAENSTPSTFNRRTTLKAAAWSVPVVAVAAATPAAAASTVPDACVAARGTWSVQPGQTLFHDGKNEYEAGTSVEGNEAWTGGTGTIGSNGPIRTTGWAPIDKVTEHSEQDPPASEFATWLWGNLAVDTEPGFLSMDDRDNRQDGNDPTIVQATYTMDGVAGETYDISMPVNTGADSNGVQYLDVNLYGPIPDQPQEVARIYVGDPGISTLEGDHDEYTHQNGNHTFTASITPSSDGEVFISYTFTLAQVTESPWQNADIWVGAPVQTNCEV